MNPHIKKRLKGSGGFRIYYYIYVTEDRLYLLFVHPKSGSMGSSNIDDDFKADIIKRLPSAIRDKQLYKLSKDKKGKRILFKQEE